MMATTPSNSFSLKGTDTSTEFSSKQKDIFSQLQSLETKYKDKVIERFSTGTNQSLEDVHVKEQSVTFKVPQLSSKSPMDTTVKKHARNKRAYLEHDYEQSQSSRIAVDGDHQRTSNLSTRMRSARQNRSYINKRHSLRCKIEDYNNPAKWTKYSLEDTNCGNDGENKTIALQFLQERQITSSSAATEEDVLNSDDKVTFHKPFSKEIQKMTNSEKSEKTVFGNVFRMPEYVVGERPKPKKTRCIVPAAEGSNHVPIYLKHLEDLDEQGELCDDESTEQNDERSKFIKRKVFRKRDTDATSNDNHDS